VAIAGCYGIYTPPYKFPIHRARQVVVRPATRSLTTLARVDYEDGTLVQVDAAQDRTGEQWARAMLEDAPAETRRALRLVWTALGLKLGSTRDERLVLGWELRRSTSDHALLGADSRMGLLGEVLLERRADALFFATFVQLQNPIARAVWARVAPGHRKAVRNLLEQAAARHHAGAS
jgi:hypothetical protein